MAIGGTVVLTLIFLSGQRKGDLKENLVSLSVRAGLPSTPCSPWNVFRTKDSQTFSGRNPKTICRDLCNSEKGSPKSWASLHTNVVCWFWPELSDAVHEKLLKGVEEQMKKSSFNRVMSFVIMHLPI